MKAKLCVIYIPGLGDTRVSGQQWAIRTWRLWGIEAEVLQMRWADNEVWNDKLQRILARIDKLTATGKLVALVGASAGASAVINAYAQRTSQVVGCVLLAGKVNHPNAIGEDYRRKNPAFVQSVFECEKALANLSKSARARILSRYAVFDSIVPRKDSYIVAAHNQTILTPGHAFTIGTQIVFGAPSFLRFLKTQVNTAKN